jgi:DNA repair exonuclease SbcCD ATPase subunit
MADLNGVLNNLNSTIASITTKVDEQKQRVKDYKTKLLEKLSQLFTQIDQLKNNRNLSRIPELQEQLKQLPVLQEQLQNKTRELEEAKSSIQELQSEIQRLQQDIESKNTQINDLTNSGKEKDKAIQELDAQYRELDKQKEQAENNLKAKTEEIDSLVNRIQAINTSLTNQIQLINLIADELGDLDRSDIGNQFEAITSNIQAIVNMIGESGAGAGGAEYNTPQFSGEIEQLYRDFMNSEQPTKDAFYRSLNSQGKSLSTNKIQSAIGNARNNNEPAINTIKQELKNLKDSGVMLNFNNLRRGGKRIRKRKTIKKCNRRTRKKMRGGYVYSGVSKELDRASSIISTSSRTKTANTKSSNTKSSNTRTKKRRSSNT